MMHPVVFAIAAMLAISAFLFASSLIPTKNALAARLEELEGTRWTADPKSRAELFARIFNDKQRTKLERLLMEAGRYTITPAKIGLRVVAGAVAGGTFGVAFAAYSGSWDFPHLVPILLGTVLGAYLPVSKLKAAVKKRKTDLQRALPDLLDMLSATVQAGLSFNAALGYALETAAGALGEELRAVLSEIRLGRTRADALKSMANRVRVPDISTMVTAIVQAERLGANLSKVLEELSEEVRNKRMMRAEEIAATMPTKMVIPMALFMLPALFVMIFGGVVAQYRSK